jgi:hypothetical protein
VHAAIRAEPVKAKKKPNKPAEPKKWLVGSLLRWPARAVPLAAAVPPSSAHALPGAAGTPAPGHPLGLSPRRPCRLPLPQPVKLTYEERKAALKVRLAALAESDE